MHKLRINPLAKQDLIDIKEYITNEHESTSVAVNGISKIIDSYENLKQFPMLGVELSSKIDIPTNYRYLISGNYLIFYKVNEIYVSIYRILYTRQDYIKILFRDNNNWCLVLTKHFYMSLIQNVEDKNSKVTSGKKLYTNYLIAIIVVFSRTYIYVHFPTYILVTIAIACFCSIASCYIFKLY